MGSNGAKMFFIQYTGKNIHGIEGKIFLPGLNQVTLEEFEKLSSTPAFKFLIDSGALRWQGPSPEQKEKEYPLEDLHPAAVQELVEQTIDEEVLKKIKKADKRKSIVEQAESQMEKIQPTEADFQGPIKDSRKAE